MEILDREKRTYKSTPKTRSSEMVLGAIAIVSAVTMVWAVLTLTDKVPILIIGGIVFTLCIVGILVQVISPDSIRARQTDSMLQLSSQMIDHMKDGMTPEAAQAICSILLPNTAALAVSITDKNSILGYVGYLEAENPQGAKLRTRATHDALSDGKIRVIHNQKDIGLPENSSMINAAIVVPLCVGHEIIGVLKFYYKSSRKITETQKSIAQGLGDLLATQMAASKLEEQRELATSMELKMLQSQINPHFLFNTINTIASLIRTEPAKARILLRDFAVFYRSTLENSQDKIPLARELDQTARYFSFEVARFGEDRLELVSKIDTDGVMISQMEVPPFLLQPIVENAVKHAMPAQGKLTVKISAEVLGEDVLLHVEDNGVGMDAVARQSIMHPKSQTGMGIAVKNVHDRMHGFYGPDAQMDVKSTLGKGTEVTLRFPKMADTLIVIDE